MTVYLGTGTFNKAGNYFEIASPQNFNSLYAIRLSNLTGDVLIVKNIQSTGQSTEYLLPYQQNVYKTENLSAIPKFTGLYLGNSVDTAALLVEWSDEPDTDFPGTYPVDVAIAATITSGVGLWTFTDDYLADGGTDGCPYTVSGGAGTSGFTYTPGFGFVALSTTIVNTGTGDILFARSASGAGLGIGVPITEGSSLTFDNGASFWLVYSDPAGSSAGFGTTTNPAP